MQLQDYHEDLNRRVLESIREENNFHGLAIKLNFPVRGGKRKRE